MRGIRNGNRVDRLTMCVECVNGRSRGEMRFPGKKVPVQVRLLRMFS